MTMAPRNGSEYIAPDITIERMNTDKSRREIGSAVAYQLFFELSGTPAPEWRAIFFREWQAAGSAHHTELDGAFLILHCSLADMTPAVLAALQKAAATANEQYHIFAQDAVTKAARREQEWKQERLDVEAVASTLHFSS